MDKEAAGGGAALPGGADGAKQNCARCQFQIGRGGDNDGVVAAQFQQRPAQAALHFLGEVAAHFGGAGGGEEGKTRVAGHGPAHLAPADDEAENGGVHLVGAANAFGNFDRGNRAEGSLAGRFPHGGVTANGGQGAVPGPDGHGEIKSGDDPDNAQGMPLLEEAVPRAFRGDGQAVKLAGKAGGKIADINHLLHFAFPFGHDFSRFEGDEPAQIRLGLAQGVAELADNFAPFRRGQVLPGGEGLPGPREGLFVIAGPGRADPGQRFAVNGRDAGQEWTAAAPLPAKHAGVDGAQPKLVKKSRQGSARILARSVW